jgi:ankyrin repeat protein
MRLLLGAKAKVEAADNRGYDPASHAALTGDTDTVLVLLVAGAAPAGWILLWAARVGHDQMVRLLITRGANVNERSRCGFQFSALHLAARMGHLQVLQELLAAGADVEAMTNAGSKSHTPLCAAIMAGQEGAVQLLLANGAEVNTPLSNGMSPLLVAANGGHAEVFKLLLAAGADVNYAYPNNNKTALHGAAAFGHVEITELLLSAGADIEAKAGLNALNYTPLHEAAAKGHAAVARKLLDAGADIHAVARSPGNTPLNVAAEKGHLEVVELLLESLLASGEDIGNDTALAARQAAHKGHMHLWAVLALKVQRMNPEQFTRCVVGFNPLAASRALIAGWEGEVKRHEEVLEAARRERAEGEAAREKAQQLIIQSALMQKQLERSRSELKKG